MVENLFFFLFFSVNFIFSYFSNSNWNGNELIKNGMILVKLVTIYIGEIIINCESFIDTTGEKKYIIRSINIKDLLDEFVLRLKRLTMNRKFFFLFCSMLSSAKKSLVKRNFSNQKDPHLLHHKKRQTFREHGILCTFSIVCVSLCVSTVVQLL